MKIIFFALMLSFINSCNATNQTSLPSLAEQESFYSDLQSKSWKNIQIRDHGIQKSASDYLIDTIKLHNNMSDENIHTKKKKRLKRLIRKLPLQYNGQDFWEMNFKLDYKMKDVFLGNYNSNTNLSIHNTPRQLQFILHCRDLLQYKQNFHEFNGKNIEKPILSHSNFHVDDVVRAMSLSGKFCFRRNETFTPIFSGMLLPGQHYNSNFFTVITCLHGFLQQDISNIFFLPYGIDEQDDDDKPNLKNYFQVQHVSQSFESPNIIDPSTLQNIGNDYEYSHDDLAIAYIERISYRDDRSLKKVLKERNQSNIFNDKNLFSTFFANSNELPHFLGEQPKFTEKFDNFNLNDGQGERFYIIGHPGNPVLRFNDSGFAVVTNTTDKISHNSHHSLDNNPTLFTPQRIGSMGRISIDFANWYGMSGGIIIVTYIVEKDNITYRVGLSYASVWGSEREFEGNQIKDLKSFGNVIH